MLKTVEDPQLQFFDGGVVQLLDRGVVVPFVVQRHMVGESWCSRCSLENPGHHFLSPFLTVPLRGVYASVNGGFWTNFTAFSLRSGHRCSFGARLQPVVVQRQVFWSRQCRKLFVRSPVWTWCCSCPLCNNSCRSLLGVQYIDKLLMCSCYAVAGSLHGALLCAMPGRIALVFYMKGNSDLEVVSVLLSGGWVCVSR